MTLTLECEDPAPLSPHFTRFWPSAMTQRAVGTERRMLSAGSFAILLIAEISIDAITNILGVAASYYWVSSGNVGAPGTVLLTVIWLSIVKSVLFLSGLAWAALRTRASHVNMGVVGVVCWVAVVMHLVLMSPAYQLLYLCSIR